MNQEQFGQFWEQLRTPLEAKWQKGPKEDLDEIQFFGGFEGAQYIPFSDGNTDGDLDEGCRRIAQLSGARIFLSLVGRPTHGR